MTGRKLKRKIDIVWNHGRVVGDANPPPPYRYRPQSYGIPGSHGWGVWDAEEDRWIEEDELIKIPDEQLEQMLPDSTN